MVKLTFFVHCTGWKEGGYENVHYFETEKEARDYIKRDNERLKEIKSDCYVSIVKIEEVSLEEFAEDYMGGCY